MDGVQLIRSALLVNLSHHSNEDDADREAREALAGRIRELADGFATRAEAARAAGISPQQLHNLMTGKNSPSLLAAARIAAARGRSLEWLAYGREPERSRGLPTSDRELMGRVVEAIVKVYEEERVPLPPLLLGSLAAQEYDVIVASAEDLAGRETMLRGIAARLRRDLQDAARSRVVRRGA